MSSLSEGCVQGLPSEETRVEYNFSVDKPSKHDLSGEQD